MKKLPLHIGLALLTILIFQNCKITQSSQNEVRFNTKTDLLIMQYDCKTDVDDLHSVAAFKTLLSDAKFKGVNYHAVAGTYGIQEGLYVPPNQLFELAFGNNWTDAHADRQTAIEQVKSIVTLVLNNQGDVWIAEAGQSDFSAALIMQIRAEMPELNTSERIHIVQHSNWNEEVTSPESLEYVKQYANYHKIPDGNAVGNGTPGFRDPDFSDWESQISDSETRELWQLAVELGNKYNGAEGRYNNEAVSAGGLDFSDLSEVCWILGIEDIKDAREFFRRFTFKTH